MPKTPAKTSATRKTKAKARPPKKVAARKTKSGTGASVASRLPANTPAQVRAAKEKFEKGILARGEASPAGKPLKPGATHAIVGTNKDGTPILKRKRFSLV